MSKEYILHTEKRHGCTIKLVADNDAESPREWDNVGTMVCWHRRYRLGDEQPDEEAKEYMREIARKAVPTEIRDLELRFNTARRRVAEWDYKWDRALDSAYENREEKLIEKAMREHLVVLPLCLYDHSGITMSTGRFSCPWDSGQVGYIYCTMKRARKEWSGTDDEVREQAKQCLEGEVQTYDDHITNNVCGFTVEAPDGELIESCWGFYPDHPVPFSFEKAWDAPLSQARNAADRWLEFYGERDQSGEHDTVEVNESADEG